MGRQIEKIRKKTLTDVNASLAAEKVKPAVDKTKHAKESSLFSCTSLLLMILTVILAIIITSIIIKAAEYQQLNDDQQQTILQMSANAEDLKQKYQKVLLDCSEKSKQKEILIKSLQSEKDDLNARLKGLGIQLANADEAISEYKTNEIALKEVNKNKDDEITSLNLEKNANMDTFETEKKTMLEKLDKAEQEKSSIQKDSELAIRNINSLNEAETKELNSILLQKEDEILMKSKTIESLQIQSKTLSDEMSQLSENIESLNLKNTQLSEDLVLNSETIESLKEQSLKCSNDLVVFRDERNKEVKSIKQEKESCIRDHEMTSKSCLENIQIKEDDIRELKDENETLEKMTKQRIVTIESEHKSELDALEESKGSLVELLKSERQEKNNVMDENTSLARALEDLQLEAENIIHNLKMSQTDLEKCKKEKLIESDQREEFVKKITILSDEKFQMESDCRDTTEKLAKLELEKEELNKKMKKTNNKGV